MEESNPQGEFHHFQLVNSNGEIPISISVLVHYNQPNNLNRRDKPPINSEDIIKLHDELESFDGDFIKAFSQT